LLDTRSLSPHGFCLLWRPELLWTHVISDAAIALAYFSIPAALAYLLAKRRDIDFRPVGWAFAVFILSCGATHVMSIWTLWRPDYGAEALVKALTAFASVFTAVALWILMPAALAWPSPRQLEAVNGELRHRIGERDAALLALKRETAGRLEAEQRLHRAQKMEAVGQLTGGVAHDFNNLMAVVLANLERLETRIGTDAASRKALANAQTGAERAARLTKQLLAFSRQQPLTPTAADVNEIVVEADALTRGLLPAAIERRLDLTPGLAAARVDFGEAVNALINLIVNARDAMDGSGTLTLSTAGVEIAAGAAGALAPGRYVVARVSDTGTGMSDDTRERAFEPFFTTKPVGAGTGLGLSQVFGFARQSGGDAVIESQIGAGSTITLYLPVDDPAS
jgi:signal transduction histidine kinase